MQNKTVVVIGGGAAGFFCAANVARLNPALNVIILEKQNKVLQKVKVSGGGRCNVTHACFQTSELIKKYPRGKQLLKKTLQQFSPKETIAWFKERNVILKTELDGRMFPTTDSSQTIIDCLLKEASNNQIDLRLNKSIQSIEPVGKQFKLTLSDDSLQMADYVVVACGGFPKLEQYKWIQALGHEVESPLPSLFTFNIPSKPLLALMGLVAENAIVRIMDSPFVEQGPVLVTHWGLSGPGILKLSAWAARELNERNYQFSILINWLGIPENEVRNAWNEHRNKLGASQLGSKNPFGLPTRLWQYILETTGISLEMKWSELPSKMQNKLIHTLTTQQFDVSGKTTFKEEFVTCGGIKINELFPDSLESKLVPNLFFAGEIIDVDGITGGFNFQHAWASGYLAAKAIVTKSLN